MKTEKDIKRDFNLAVNKLRKVVVDAKELWPNAQLYLASGTLNLMKGAHHSEPNQVARYDNIVDSQLFHEMDGGDW
jgi:hypothetical protein